MEFEISRFGSWLSKLDQYDILPNVIFWQLYYTGQHLEVFEQDVLTQLQQGQSRQTLLPVDMALKKVHLIYSTVLYL
jgi:hypothetical protein